LAPGSRDPGWKKNPNPGYGTNITDRISENLVLVFGLKILKLFYTDPDPGFCQPGSGTEKSRIRDKHPGSATLSETLKEMGRKRTIIIPEQREMGRTLF
jgi:hypothetical protein